MPVGQCDFVSLAKEILAACPVGIAQGGPSSPLHFDRHQPLDDGGIFRFAVGGGSVIA
jgi:hypothetical protein